MRECNNSKIHISSNFLLSISLIITLDTLLLVPSLHCNTSLHFTKFIDTSLPLIYTSLPSHVVNKVALELILLQVIRFLPISISVPVLHIQFYVINTLTIRTSGRSLGTVMKALIFVKREGLGRNVLSLFF